MKELFGKSVLITGGAGGIGFAAAETFAAQGAKVAIVDLSAEAGQKAVAALQEKGCEAIFVQADVSKAEQVEAYVRATTEAFGSIDVFINNAGWEGAVTPLIDYDEDTFDRVIAINVRGVFLGLKYVLRQMYAQGSGVVINVASVAGHVGSPGIIPYTASKHAVLGMTKTAALEAVKHGVRINAVSPGPVETRMIESLASGQPGQDHDAAMQAYANAAANGRMAVPQDVANVMLFLASDLSKHMLGQSFRVDGGRIMY